MGTAFFFVLLPAALIVGGILWLHHRFIAPRQLDRAGRPPSVSRWERMRDVAADSLRNSGAWAWIRRKLHMGAPAPAAVAVAPAPATPLAPAAAAAARPASPLAELPDEETDPDEVRAVQNAPVPPEWVTVIGFIATFEPENAEAVCALGICLAMQNKPSEARQNFDSAFAMNKPLAMAMLEHFHEKFISTSKDVSSGTKAMVERVLETIKLVR